ncbi:thioesterase family protein [Noviherbaspirillum denitrificans]|uniref:thioesterase family protein n=1 Tax=Noviherbaspirillum denitrificans TaxID=1968433 RepID=UPI0014825A14|nr:thioesterase [Noviherbaspirillum denitrificans]
MLNSGDSARLQMLVSAPDLAAAYGDSTTESYPEVLSSPAMLGLMERACARLLAPMLGDGEMSVGARVEFTHFSPTPLGATIEAVATFDRKEGGLYWFYVVVTDGAGEVGRGKHARAIVRRHDIEGKACSKKAV